MENRLIPHAQKIVVCFLISVFFISCTSSSMFMKKGDYDSAIHKSVKKLKRKKQNDNEVVVLEQSYLKANERDTERITFLKKEGKPDNWDQILSIYSKMNQRQQIIKPLLPLRVTCQNREAHFVIVNYDDEIIQAKRNATEYFYAHALSLLERNNKADARTAYGELLRAKAITSNYKDVEKELVRAKNMGTSYVLFKMKNTTGIPLPPSFEDELYKISLSELNGQWLSYYTHETKGWDYDYTIVVNMKRIDVSPEGIKEINYTETKVVPDGFQYILDAHGNVRKDSLGNDMKKPKTKTISCDIIETYQTKKAIIGGTLDYWNNKSGQIIKTDPIASEKFFEYRSSVAVGDINALKPETKAKLGNRPVPFPSGFDMLLQAGQTLKDMVKTIILNNKGVIY